MKIRSRTAGLLDRVHCQFYIHRLYIDCTLPQRRNRCLRDFRLSVELSNLKTTVEALMAGCMLASVWPPVLLVAAAFSHQQVITSAAEQRLLPELNSVSLVYG